MLISAPTIASQSIFHSLADTRINRTSMVPTCLHNPDLLLLMGNKISLSMVQYVAQNFVYAIEIDERWQSTLPSPPPTPTKPTRNPTHAVVPTLTPLPPLEDFIADLVQHSGAKVATLLSTLIYLKRLRERISTDVKGMLGARHRIFLATLIVAAKYLNDSGPKNVHWTAYARCFDIVEVNMMENQLLTILNYELRFDETEAWIHFAPFLDCIRGQHLFHQSTIFRTVEGSKTQERAANLPLTPPSSEGSNSDSTPPHLWRPSSQRFSSTSIRHSKSYHCYSTPTTVLSFIGTGINWGDEITYSTDPALSSTGDADELEKKQAITMLPRPMSDELERAPGQQNPKPLVLRAVPAAVRRKPRSRCFVSASVNLKPCSDERISDELSILSEQHLSRKVRERASRARRPPFDDFWRKIQSNLSKLTLVNSGSQPSNSVAVDDSKECCPAQSEAGNYKLC